MFVITWDDGAKRVLLCWWEVDLLCFCRNLDEGGSDILQLSGFGAVVRWPAVQLTEMLRRCRRERNPAAESNLAGEERTSC
jgi:hypothetical protein